MHASGPRACCQCWRECRGGGLNALSIPSCRRGGHCKTSSQPLVRGDLRPHAESPASGFRAWRSPSVQLSGALSRRRRCRTSVSRLRQRKSSPRSPPLLSKCFPPLMRVGYAAPNSRDCIRGWAAETGPRPGSLKAGSGVASHLTFSAFPEGARFFARWALKNRKVESGGRARRT